MTTIIATSVIRDRVRGESDGGVHLVDIENRRVARVLHEHSHEGSRKVSSRDGGLRGIAFDSDRVFVAARDELFVFSPDFEPIACYRSPYLKECQSIAVFKRRLFLVSAAYDSVLGFDLDQMRFSLGLHIVSDDDDFRAMPFDPNGQKGPQFVNRLLLNSVYANEKGLYICGLNTFGLLLYGGKHISRFATLPAGVYDARPWRGGVLFNDSPSGFVRYVTPEKNHVFPVPCYPNGEVPGAEPDKQRRFPPPLARGLCTLDDHLIAAGSSPSSISLHDVNTMQTTLALNLSSDFRSAIYSLEVWPFDGF